MTDNKITVVDRNGDVVLHFLDSEADVDQQYRCSREPLRQVSRYFDVLFDPAKFNEGQEVEIKLGELLKTFNGVASIPPASLPKVIIRDVGEISAEERLRILALHTFLELLHVNSSDKLEEGNVEKWRISTQQSLAGPALLVTLAEHFDAIDFISQCLKSDFYRTLFQVASKRDLGPKTREVYARQQLLVGMVLHRSSLTGPSSARLIWRGSQRWAVSETSRKDSLWNKLPHGLEEELHCRREYILEAISSLPSFFIGLYSSKQQQCKLGYDTSPQCDSFQLGEMIRFFTRKGLLELQSTFSANQDQPIYTDDIMKIIERLRHCPSYQLDSNHRHCGLRNRILPLLDIFFWAHSLEGICLKCWTADPRKESWLSNPTGGSWDICQHKAFPVMKKRGEDECLRHIQLKAMYTAEERKWVSSCP